MRTRAARSSIRRVAASVLATVVVLGGGPARADAGEAPAGRGLEVVAGGLDSPRGLAFGPHGVLYVAEAGRGGSGPCNIGPGGVEFCVGPTGAITAVRGRHQRRVATGLPSYGNRSGTFVLGPNDIGVLPGGRLHVVVGLGLNPADRSQLGPLGTNLGRLLEVTGRGRWYPIADVARYELEHNPDQGIPGARVESNAHGLLEQGGRRVLVVDSAGNSLLAIDGRRRISTVAVFPDLPDPSTGEMLDAVPTSVVRGPDGALYVGQLTGFPYPPGQAKVFRVVPGHQPTVHAAGFTNIIDLAVDRQGRLLVLEIATNGLLSGDATGALKRLERDGSVTVLAREGLVHPTSVAVHPSGTVYISNRGRSVGAGEILRLRP